MPRTGSSSERNAPAAAPGFCYYRCMSDLAHDTIAEAIAAAALRLGITPPELRQIAALGDEQGLLLIRCEQALAVLCGGDVVVMRHWMRTRNEGTGGVPAQQVVTPAGLAAVLDYLEALARTST